MSGMVVIKEMTQEKQSGQFACLVTLNEEERSAKISIETVDGIRVLICDNELLEELSLVNIAAKTQLVKLIFSLSKGEHIELPVTIQAPGG